MNKKEIIIGVLITIGMIGLYMLNMQRLSDYDDCYMAKYEDWSTDCELGGVRQ